jgi:antitoxin (DNA-binding transcriptional repressor) of toxin-antitoxin stability system
VTQCWCEDGSRLRNNGAAVLDRVARGEELIVRRDGAEVAELRPRRRPSPVPAELIERRRHLLKVDRLVVSPVDRARLIWSYL